MSALVATSAGLVVPEPVRAYSFVGGWKLPRVGEILTIRTLEDAKFYFGAAGYTLLPEFRMPPRDKVPLVALGLSSGRMIVGVDARREQGEVLRI